MPNVLILPRSADYSEEVWMEIRDKAISVLQTFFFDGVIPKNAISDTEGCENEIDDEIEQYNKLDKVSTLEGSVGGQLTDDIQVSPEDSLKKGISWSRDSPSQLQGSGFSQNSANTKSDGRRSRSGKKAKKRHARQKSLQKPDDPSALEKESTSHKEDDTAMSGTDQASSRCASPEELRSRKTPIESIQESTSKKLSRSSKKLSEVSGETLKDGCVVALYARDRPALHISRQRHKGGGWILETMSNVTKRDPAAQFLICKSKVCRRFFLLSVTIWSAQFELIIFTSQHDFWFFSSGHNRFAFFYCWRKVIAGNFYTFSPYIISCEVFTFYPDILELNVECSFFSRKYRSNLL